MKSTYFRKGYTLVELLVILVIVGVLSAAGIRAYGQFKIESTREEAKIALVSAHAYIERTLIEENSISVDGYEVPDELQDNNYTISIVDDSDSGANGIYYLLAEVNSDSKQVNDSEECQSLVLYQDGYKTNTPEGDANICW